MWRGFQSLKTHWVFLWQFSKNPLGFLKTHWVSDVPQMPVVTGFLKKTHWVFSKTHWVFAFSQWL
jgi:hypothetical protein